MRTSIKLLIILFVIILLGFIVILYSRIKISSIECSSQFGQCDGVLSSELSQLIGKNIFHSREEVEKVLSDKVYVKNYSIYYNIPDKLEVNTIINKPKYSIYNGENYLMIDDQGVTLSLSESSSLPTVNKKGRFLNVGDVVTPEELFALDLIYDIQSVYKIVSSTLYDDRLNVVIDEGLEAILPLNGDRQVLIGSLLLIVDSLEDSETWTENDVNVQIIDLRYKNPVLK